MNRILPLAGLLLASLSLGAIAHGPDAPRPRPALDLNRDGVIDRGEATNHPRLAGHFDRLDRNGDGRLDASERPRHRARGRHHAGMALQRIDTDRDGRVSRAEFDAAQAASAARRSARSPAAQDRPQRTPLDFGTIDSNRDGYLAASEMRAQHARMRPQREAARAAKVERHFTDADINRDGRLGRVEISEKMPRLAERFDVLDANRDSFITREELRAGRREHGRR